MAQEVRSFAVSVPAGTAIATPQVSSLAMPARIVRFVRVRVPPGPRGEVGLALGSASTRVIPWGANQWLVLDDEEIEWPLDGQIDSGAWQLQAYNTGAFPHTIYVTFGLDVIGMAGQAVVPSSPLPVSAITGAPDTFAPAPVTSQPVPLSPDQYASLYGPLPVPTVPVVTIPETPAGGGSSFPPLDTGGGSSFPPLDTGGGSSFPDYTPSPDLTAPTPDMSGGTPDMATDTGSTTPTTPAATGPAILAGGPNPDTETYTQQLFAIDAMSASDRAAFFAANPTWPVEASNDTYRHMAIVQFVAQRVGAGPAYGATQLTNGQVIKANTWAGQLANLNLNPVYLAALQNAAKVAVAAGNPSAPIAWGGSTTVQVVSVGTYGGTPVSGQYAPGATAPAPTPAPAAAPVVHLMTLDEYNAKYRDEILARMKAAGVPHDTAHLNAQVKADWERYVAAHGG